ncbi:hypothetical protein [Corynebacterium pyruviciproducens]|uniref:hypothetical protein n=1 Tax=Corynebacterium pyruviciproducens TaxID=598660 RepID=UPI0003A4FF52|nr:hypothetical protein [Corynebacterium pyruviciproducens]
MTWPEGYDAPPAPADDRELGFIAKLGDGHRPVERFGRAFVRADAQIDAVQHVSNVEKILDTAEKRVSGDVGFSRDIETAGLAGQVPGEDFTVGDLVPVRVWNRVLHGQLVTKVTHVGSVSEPVGWRVHVGDQLIYDADALRTASSEVERTIAQERRETSGRLDEVRQTASEAKSAASAADSKADAALSEVRDKAGELGKLLDRAEAAVADGRVADEAAQKLLVESRTKLDSAVAKLAEVERLLAQSDAKLAENKALAEIVKGIRAGVEKTGKEIDAQLVQARRLNDEAKTASAEAASHGAAAKEALAGTRELHDQVAVLLEDTARYVKESRESLAESRRLSEAAERSKVDAVAGAEKARVMAEQAEATLTKVAGKSAEVDKALVEVRDLKAKAGQAVTDAGGVLDQAKAAARATGADKDAVAALYRQIVDKHQAILSLHGEMLAVQADINAKQQAILEAHEQAIKVTARAVKALAGSQAAMAGTLAYLQEALEAAQRAIDAANSAIESNRQAIRRLDEIQRMHEKAIRELSAMTTELQKAQVKLAETNATILTTQANLKKTDDQLKQSNALIQKQVDNNTVAQETTNRAVRALGGSVGAMAGSLAYMQESQENTQKTARDALDAAAANTESLRIQREVNAKALAVAKDAESVATGTRAIALATKYASQVNSVAIENSKRRQDFIDKILLWTADTLRMQRPVEWMQGGGGSNASSDYEKYFTLNTSYGANSVYVNLQGSWDGHLKITLYMRSGLTDFAQWSIAGGRTESVYAGHDKKRIAGITGGAGQEVRGVEIIATPITLPDGTKPVIPQDPVLEPIPPMPKEFQQ